MNSTVIKSRSCLKASTAVVGITICTVHLLCAQTPLPRDISITPPSPAVPREAAVYSGAWLGSWGGELPSALVVEQINADGKARVIYSWGDSRVYGFKAGWTREAGQISNGKLHLSSTNGPAIDFMFEQSGKLSGQYQMPNTPPSFAEMERVPGTNPAAILAAAKKPVVTWEEIQIPVHSQVEPTKGKTFKLQTTVYRQASAGKHPVVISNHGSTGPGIVPKEFAYRGGNEEGFFHSLGYIVVIPMRKGRGQSEGPYLEEDETIPASVGLDSAIEDLHAVVEFVSKQNDVAPTRIVLTGVSRGGLLSVACAGRYPTNIVGVINFSGGWFGEGTPLSDFNFETFGKAGHESRVPMLWLYADHDSFYSLKFIERAFAKFRDSGGHGELVEVRDIPGEGHLLCLWVDRWRSKATLYLNGL